MLEAAKSTANSLDLTNTLGIEVTAGKGSKGKSGSKGVEVENTFQLDKSDATANKVATLTSNAGQVAVVGNNVTLHGTQITGATGT